MKFLTVRVICFVIMIVMISAQGVGFAATSVSQYGITWYFSEDRPVGQFVNGDWWVVGPITLININPKTGAGEEFPNNGSMINPVPGVTQGLCNPGGYNNTPAYDSSKNISLRLPVTVQAGNSVYSVMNNPDTWATGAAAEKTWFKETAVLTVVSAAPVAGSFRPPYAGTEKTIKSNWNKAAMNYSVLRKLSPPIAANVPDRAWMETATQRPLLEMHYNFVNSNWKASWAENKSGGYPRRTYGREVSHISSGAGLYLQTNVSDSVKERLAINMCQWGIDVFGLINAGMQWQPNGGHNHGRLIPLYIAAKVLGDSEILAKCNPTKSSFQEFSQHWFVSQEDINTPRSNSTIAPYTQAHLGMPEWNSGGAYERNQASSDWNATGYRFINGAPNCGVVATILLMGGRAEVNWEPLFQYIISRYYPTTKGGASHTLPAYGDSPTLFTRDMWDAYVSNTAPPPVVPPTDSFVIGDRVETTTSTNVRNSGSLSGALLGAQALGSLGTIIAGPVVSDNITWWQVNFDNGVDGWSGGDNFILSDNTSVPPSAPTGLKVVQ